MDESPKDPQSQPKQQPTDESSSPPVSLGYESGRDRLQRNPPSLWAMASSVVLGLILGIFCLGFITSAIFGTGGLRLPYISDNHAMIVLCLILTAVTVFSLVQIIRKPGWQKTSRWSVAGILIGVGVVLLVGGLCAGMLG